jgi:hypothetical protein
MTAFNAWYYSFSPPVANHIANNWIERTVTQITLYPLIGILALSYDTFNLASSHPELAVLISGLQASLLIGAMYLGIPAGLLRRRISRLRSAGAATCLWKLLGLMIVTGLALLVPGQLLKSADLLMIGSVIAVLSTVSLSALVTSGLIVTLLKSDQGRIR